MDEQDLLWFIERDELGVRPLNWFDSKTNDKDLTINYFGKENTTDITVYSAEFQQTTFNGKKVNTVDDDDGDATMSDDDESEFDRDPETGEKIFRGADTTTVITSPNSKWIEEYLSNIESSSSSLSNQELLPATTITNSDLPIDDLPFSLLDNVDDQTASVVNSSWYPDLFLLDEQSTSMMLTDPFVPAHLMDDESNNKSQLNRTASPILFPSNLPGGSLSSSRLSVSSEDEYSMSSGSARRTRLFSGLESDSTTRDSEIIFETKTEKIDHDEDFSPATIRRMTLRRMSTRTLNQGQQDEELLRQHNIPLHLTDITQSNTEEYNRHLAHLSYLSVEQIHIIKDIRRRGKNKIAAQNCRKRKAINVESLLEEVDELKRIKHELEERKKTFEEQIGQTRTEFEFLHRQVLPDRQLPPAIVVK